MNDLDEIRSALSHATRAPGEMQARPAAGTRIRGEAIRRRQRTRAAGAVAVSGCLALAAAVFASGALTSQNTATELPASRSSASAAPDERNSEIEIAHGPHTFTSPLEIHRVEQAHDGADCPADVETVLSVDGTECFVLGSSPLVITQVEGLQVGPQIAPDGNGFGPGRGLLVSMTDADGAAFFDLTEEVSPLAEPRNRLAMVVNDKVYWAPTTATIPGGEVEIAFGDETDLRPFLAELGVEVSQQN